MSFDALRTTTLALQRLLHEAVARPSPTDPLIGDPNDWVSVGPLDGAAASTVPVSLFLFHVEPNKEMRNAPREGPDLAGNIVSQESLALDLRYLISVKRDGSAGDMNELTRMGQILAKLQANPTLTGAALPNQQVRLTPEPYPMEELSRVWSLLEKPNYRTSVVYLAAPVFIDAVPNVFGPPVDGRRVDAGLAAEPPDIFGRRGAA